MDEHEQRDTHDELTQLRQELEDLKDWQAAAATMLPLLMMVDVIPDPADGKWYHIEPEMKAAIMEMVGDLDQDDVDVRFERFVMQQRKRWADLRSGKLN